MKIVDGRVLPKKFGDLYIGDVFSTELTAEYQSRNIYMKISGPDTACTAVCLSEPGGGVLEHIASDTIVYPYPDATLILNKFVEE